VSYETVLGQHGARRLDDESDEDEVPDTSKKEDDVLERSRQHLKKQSEERIGRIKYNSNRGNRSDRSQSNESHNQSRN
jgi:hypothetical protein